MNYLICQDWSNTTDNHAGMKNLCLQLELRYPDEYKTFVIPDFYRGFGKCHLRNFLKRMVGLFRFQCFTSQLFSSLSKILDQGDKVFLMEYMEQLYPQLCLARRLKNLFPDIRVYGMVHLIPKKLEQSFTQKEFSEWTQSVDGIVTLGTSLTSYFIGKGVPRAKVFTTFHYVDEYYCNEAPIRHHDCPTVIAMGNQERNTDLLRQVVVHNPDVRFIICQGIADLSSEFAHFSNVLLIPFVPEEQLRQYMEESDISLNIMKDTIGSNVIVTSLAMGLAMVCSDVGSIRDYCDESNALFCNTEDDFSKAIKLLSKQRKVLNDMQAAAAKRGAELTIGCFSEQLHYQITHGTQSANGVR